jgi:hypothetical protein
MHPESTTSNSLDDQERLVFGASMLIAPFLFALSSFFWVGEGQYDVTGGTLLIFGSLAWILAFTAMFRSLRDVAPWYAAAGFLVAVYGAVCGVAFALQDLFLTLFGIEHQASLQALSRHPFVSNAIFWIGGPAFPLSLLVLGIVLARARATALWAGIALSLAGVLFPLSRVFRLEGVTHMVDVLMLVPMWYMGVAVIRGKFGVQPNRQRPA